MGKKSKPPPPPDYAALATQQAALNKTAATEQTVTNRPNQTTPWGNTSWSHNPTTGQWDQKVTLNPEDQASLDSNRKFDNQKLGIASGLLGKAGDAMGQPLDYSGLPVTEGYDTSKLSDFGSFDQSKLGDFGSMDLSQLMGYRGFGSEALPELINSVGGTGSGPGFSMGNAKGLLDVDMSKLNGDFGAVEGVRNAMMARMAPQRQQAREAEIQRLKNQGIPENSEAWTRALTRLDQGDTDANQQALLGAAGEYGNIFNRNLAAQGLNTSNARANRGQLATEAKYGAEEGRLGAAQSFDQALQSARLGNSARAQNYDERMGLSQESRIARKQQFDEMGATAEFANRIRGQKFDEQGKIADFANRIHGQQFDEQGKVAALTAALRQQKIGERTAKRNAPLDDFMKLTAGINPSMPQMPSFMGGTGYAAADMYGAGSDQYKAGMDQYNAQQAKSAGIMKGLMGLGGAALGGPMFGLGGMFGGKP